MFAPSSRKMPPPRCIDVAIFFRQRVKNFHLVFRVVLAGHVDVANNKIIRRSRQIVQVPCRSGDIAMKIAVLREIQATVKISTDFGFQQRVNCGGIVQPAVKIFRENDIPRRKIFVLHAGEGFVEKIAPVFLKNQDEIPIAAHDEFGLFSVFGAERADDFNIVPQKIFRPLSTFASVVPQHNLEHKNSSPKKIS